MYSSLRKLITYSLHPILKRMASLYLSKPRRYKYKSISVKVLPGVFHPGLFLSTKIFVEFLESIKLQGKRVLELGAGSGLISIYCATKNADVTASDINPTAIEGIKENASDNVVELNVILSDLFDNLNVNDYEIILINPPYYPRQPKNIAENAWFCGEDFQYFKKLFRQLGMANNSDMVVYMILSEDCAIDQIMSIASENGLYHQQVHTRKIKMEDNFIFRISLTARQN